MAFPPPEQQGLLPPELADLGLDPSLAFADFPAFSDNPFGLDELPPLGAPAAAAPPPAAGRPFQTGQHEQDSCGPDQQQQRDGGSAEDRLERARALNRAKQARFRQRQKDKRDTMEQQYESTAADLERARALNETMRQSATLMEAVQAHKDQALGMLQQASAASAGGAQQQQQQPQQQQAAASCGQAAASMLLSRPASGGGSGADSGGAESGDREVLLQRSLQMPFLERVQMCSEIFNSNEQAKQTLRREVTSAERDSLALHVDVKRTLGEQLVQAHPVLLEAALATPPELLLRDWAEFGELAYGLVQQVESGQLSEKQAEKRLRPVVLYQTLRNTLLLGHKPERLLALVQHTRLPGETEQAAAQRWLQVSLSMGMAADQHPRILSHYQAYCARMEQLGQEAASSLATLQEVQQSLDTQLAQLGNASLSSMVQQYLGLFEATSVLSQQPTAALLALMDLFAAAGSATTFMQKVRMIAASRPFYPDVPAVMREGLVHRGLLPPDAGTAPHPMPLLQALAEPATSGDTSLAAQGGQVP